MEQERYNESDLAKDQSDLQKYMMEKIDDLESRYPGYIAIDLDRAITGSGRIQTLQVKASFIVRAYDPGDKV